MKTCSFFGHRNTQETPELKKRLKELLLVLIEKEGVTTFLFGSASRFDDLCLKMVSEIKKEGFDVKRVYVRSQHRELSVDYKKYLLTTYDDTVMPCGVEKAGRAAYVERNQEMINASDYCVFYYNPQYMPPKRKQSKCDLVEYQPQSGTHLAFEYASGKVKKGELKNIFNLYGEN